MFDFFDKEFKLDLIKKYITINLNNNVKILFKKIGIITDNGKPDWLNAVLCFLIFVLTIQLFILNCHKSHNTENGVIHIRTKDKSISTKIEQKVRPDPRYYGKKRNFYRV